MAIWRGAGGSGDATTDAANQASVASNAAAAALISADAAAGSATAADTSDTQANDSKVAAASSATDSANSATASANSATASAASFDQFDDRYLGYKATPPTTNNDGDPLTDGVLYYNTVADIIYVWNGTAWQTITTGSGGLEAANNLNDVASASTSRTNLGVAIGSNVQAFSSVLAGTTASYTTAEETKLAGIETAATADQTGAQIKTAYEAEANAFTDAQFTKLAGIETAADVTDGTNVTAAGALMDSEVTNLAQVKAFDTTDYATAAQGALAASATQPATTVAKTSATGSAVMPTGTTAQRDGSPATGNLRFNSTDTSFEGYDGSAWGAIGGGGGASGGGSDAIFYENGQNVTTDYTIVATNNAMSTGPITINSGVTVTVSSGARYVVI